MTREEKIELVETMHKAMVSVNKKYEELEKIGIVVNMFDDILTSFEESIRIILPNGYEWFKEWIGMIDYSAEDLFYLEEKASEIEMFNGSEITFSNGEVKRIA